MIYNNIILKREDLEMSKQDYTIDQINMYSFKQESLSQDDKNTAHIIIFDEYPFSKVLKNRYNWRNL